MLLIRFFERAAKVGILMGIWVKNQQIFADPVR